VARAASAGHARRVRGRGAGRPLGNAEYIYGKRQLREIDRRVRFLRKRLEGMVIVDQPPDDTSPHLLRRLDHARGRNRRDTRGPHRRPGRDRRGARLHKHGFAAALAVRLKRRDDEISVEVPGAVAAMSSSTCATPDYDRV
jgi:transcription elongation factor GreB